MPHFYIAPANIRDDKAVITGADVKHIKNVLRLGTGDTLSLFDGEGSVYQGKIESIGKEILLKIINKRMLILSNRPLISVAQALLKSDKMDWVIQKATELGAYEIIPFTSKRTIPDNAGKEKLRRWQKIVSEAAKQCGRGNIPEIQPVQRFEELIGKFGDDSLKLIPWEGEASNKIKVILGDSPLLSPGTDHVLCLPCSAGGQGDLSPKHSAHKVVYLIGPEGGFEAGEVDRAKKNDFIPISLGHRILKAETAAITMLAILQHEFGNL